MVEKNFYFDWAATSPVDELLLKEAFSITLKEWGNPSSSHQIGKTAKKILEDARISCANTLGVKPENIIFTSGGTESDAIPILAQLAKPQKAHILFSSIEHPAVREQANALKNCGWKVSQIPCNKNGIISVDSVINLITNETTLICIMAVNNETGAIQPIYEIADAINQVSNGKRKPKLHIDCVQAAGKIPLNINYQGIDSAAFSAHKICGPRGIGILYTKDNIESFLRGGGQEQGIRSGTENVYGAVAFSKVLEKYYFKPEDSKNESFLKQKENTFDFVKKLSELKGCTIIPQERLENPDFYSPYVVQVAFNNIPGNVMLRALDSQGIYISTGSACSSKKNKRPILEAMQVESKLRENSVRFSFGPSTTKNEIDYLFEAVKNINSTFNK